ncbi:unnamed protein product [Ectocarpus sp. 6 AP-2014]
MDWAPADVAPSSSSAVGYGEPAGKGTASPDATMVSAPTNNLNPHADPGHHPPAPPAAAVATVSTTAGPSGQAHGGWEGVAGNQEGEPNAAATARSTDPRPAGGRGRDRTPPPRSTTGPAASNSASIAVVALRALHHQQQRARAECDDLVQRGLPTQASPSPSQQNAPLHGQKQQRPSPDNGGDNKSTQKRKRKSGRKAKKKDTNEHQPAGTGATFYAPGSMPSGAWPAVPATTRPSTNPRAARGRGREATLPAWMTATQATPLGGLQPQAGPGTNSRMPGPTGLPSSGPQQGAQTTAHGDNKTKNKSEPNDKKTQGRGATTLASAAWRTDYHQEMSTTVAVHGRGAPLGTTVPSGARTNAAPGGLQQQPQLASPRAPRPLPAGLNSSRPKENNQIVSFGKGSASIKNKTKYNKKKKNNKKKKKPQAAGTSTTQSAWPSPADQKRSDGNAIIQKLAGPAPAATVESNHRAPKNGWVAAVGAFHGQGASTTVWAGGGSGPSRPKRTREEELTTAEITTRLRDPSKAPGQQQQQQTPDEIMDMVRRMASMGVATVPKKKKSTLDASREPKALIATRARFRIIHHHALPSQQQLVLYKPPTFNIASGRSGATRSNQSSWVPPARAPLAIKPSTWTTPKQPPPPPPPPPPPSPLVVIDGTDIALTYWRTDDRWSALQPLLAIQQFFKERGVPCVAFLPRERVYGVTPQDDFYTAFHEARSRRAISEIPQGANASLFILKHAIENNAYVVTNAQLSGHIASPATLASLGQTKNELHSYLSRSHVRYTFAGDDFTPDPEAPLIKMFAKQASGANQTNSNTTRGRTTESGVITSPLPHPTM